MATKDYDRSVFGDGVVDLSAEIEEADDAPSGLELDTGPPSAAPGMGIGAPPGALDGGSPLPPSALGSSSPMSPMPPPPAQQPSAIPQEAPSQFDTSSFAPGPTGPPPEAYARFTAEYFLENMKLLPDPTSSVHNSRNSRPQSADDFFDTEENK